MAVGDVLKVRIVTYHGALLNAHLGINVLHWRISAETALGVTLKEVADALDLTWGASYQALMSASADYRGTGVQRILPTLSIEFPSFAGAGPGAIATDLLSGQCGLIHKATALGGRENRGRTYIAFPPESLNDADNKPTAAYNAALTTLAGNIDITQTIVGAGGTATLKQVIFHRETNTTTDLTGFTTQTEWATQRRRMPRGKLRPVPF